jgi:hypothetical protein
MHLVRTASVMPQADNSITEIRIAEVLPLTTLLRCVRVDRRGFRVSHLTETVRTFYNKIFQAGADTLQHFNTCPVVLLSIREHSRRAPNWGQMLGSPLPTRSTIGRSMTLTLISTPGAGKSYKACRDWIESRQIHRITLLQALAAIYIHRRSIPPRNSCPTPLTFLI